MIWCSWKILELRLEMGPVRASVLERMCCVEGEAHAKALGYVRGVQNSWS